MKAMRKSLNVSRVLGTLKKKTHPNGRANGT
jgi:hypothetical protein